MDRLHGDGAYASNQTAPLPARPSVESVSSPRLQKKRSVKRVRSETRRLTAGRVDQLNTEEVDDTKQRKGSIRDAVRRIFGRRSKLPEAPVVQPSSIQSTSLKHKAHRSEPPETTRLEPPEEEEEEEEEEEARAVSAPLRRGESVDLPRIRSPNAVEFPKSRHLKPLALPTPFDDPRGTLRRRKTLASILVPPEDAKEIAAAIASAEPFSAGDYEPRRRAPVPEPGKTSRSEKRRSRSAGDLRQQSTYSGPHRKRSDEIRFWRESVQTTVLRTSGFNMPPDEALIEQDIEAHPLDSPTDDRRRSMRVPSSPFDVASGYGTEFSRDLEDRVAKLEANLNFFQRSLQRLQTDKRRRAGVVEPHARRDSLDYVRTPSMLAEDLREPLAPSNYSYGFEGGARPSTAPSRPTRPPRIDDDAPPLPTARPVESPPSIPPVPPIPAPSLPPPAPPVVEQPQQEPMLLSENETFRSLYRMLSDERSARRRLETQLREMRTDISDLQYHVTTQSQVQSQRSSFLFPAAQSEGHLAAAGSTRIQNLLNETERDDFSSPRQSMSPPRVPATPTSFPNVVSRFSASTRQESETEAMTQAGSEEAMQQQMLNTQQQGNIEQEQNERTPRMDGLRQQLQIRTNGDDQGREMERTPRADRNTIVHYVPGDDTRGGAMF